MLIQQNNFLDLSLATGILDDAHGGTGGAGNWLKLKQNLNLGITGKVWYNAGGVDYTVATKDIPFNQIAWNYGGAWDENIHRIVAPVKGLYQFNWIFFSNDADDYNKRPSILFYDKNGNMIDYVFTSCSQPVAVNRILDPGEMVSAGVYNTNFKYTFYGGGQHNAFYWSLLHPLDVY